MGFVHRITTPIPICFGKELTAHATHETIRAWEFGRPIYVACSNTNSVEDSCVNRGPPFSFVAYELLGLLF
jgi:hypothetical protein